jgi:DNA-directed RNA polymerase specialized sigma24 family protein
VSTRFPDPAGAPHLAPALQASSARRRDPAELVAIVAAAKRELLLRVHRHRLRREDLEDCYGQATLELVILARGGRAYASRAHIGNALEQRFLARVQDRRRAVSGRSPMAAALEAAIPLAGEHQTLDLPDTRAEPERTAIAREELSRVRECLGGMSEDQRLVLSWQAVQGACDDFCRVHGWSPEKYRKVAQRARSRLRALMSSSIGVPASGPLSEQAPGPACDQNSPHS